VGDVETARAADGPLQPGWVLVDGLPVFHRAGGPPDGAGEAVVHVHGFGMSGTYMEPTAALLAAHRRTFVPDLPGAGLSIRPPIGLDIEGMSSALMRYCDALGLDRIALVGNSLGCAVIVDVASRWPDRLASAVLVSPAGGPANRPVWRAAGQMALDASREPPAMVAIATRDYLRFGMRRSLALLRAMTAYPTLERLRDLAAPTLVVVGQRDPLVRRDRVGVFAGLPHVDVVVVPGAHALNYTAPAVVARLVEAHLDGVDVAASVPGVERLAVPTSGPAA
jgi:pimeloyl-ACP methyl ester carboxylesterase